VKKWEAPKLIVLVRGNPEENLIISCKGYPVNPEGPNAVATACYFDIASCLACVTDSTS
jgi:hypothetical protein